MMEVEDELAAAVIDLEPVPYAPGRQVLGQRSGSAVHIGALDTAFQEIVGSVGLKRALSERTA